MIDEKRYSLINQGDIFMQNYTITCSVLRCQWYKTGDPFIANHFKNDFIKAWERHKIIHLYTIKELKLVRMLRKISAEQLHDELHRREFIGKNYYDK